mmetsp:Transcript_37548/g.55332  ORF Transcript_37548/g.55332 Transcript_37548/m.55332 type:complete len:234 (+) Transcript_37548:1240-1941(+)
MLGNLLIPLIMLLRITPKQQPIRIRLMTIQLSSRIIPKILIIFSPGIIRIHIGTPCRPPLTIGITIPIIMGSFPIVEHIGTIDKVTYMTIALGPLFPIGRSVGPPIWNLIGVTANTPTGSPKLTPFWIIQCPLQITSAYPLILLLLQLRILTIRLIHKCGKLLLRNPMILLLKFPTCNFLTDTISLFGHTTATCRFYLVVSVFIGWNEGGGWREGFAAVEFDFGGVDGEVVEG